MNALKTIQVILLLSSAVCAQLDTRIEPAAQSGNTQVDSSQLKEQVHQLSGVQSMVSDIYPDQFSMTAHVEELAGNGGTRSNGNFQSSAQFGGQILLRRNWRSSGVVVEYAGGTGLGNTGSKGGDYQEGGVTGTYSRRRWNFVLGGHLTYLPDSTFGFNSLHNISGAVDGNVDPNFLPTQNIFTLQTTQWNQNVIGEADYVITGRSSITSSASYSRLRFQGQSLLDSNQTSATMGYDHALSDKSFVAVTYSYGRFDFSGLATQLETHGVQALYGRRLSQRATLKLGGGPQRRLYTYSGAHIDLGAPGISFTAMFNLSLALRAMNLDVSYWHMTTNGSGLLPGSSGDQATASLARRLGRTWQLGTSIGYARNSSLTQFGPVASQAFNSLYGSVQVSRNLTQTMSGFVSYGVQFQESPVSACGMVVCTGYPVHYLLTLGINFHPKPLLFKQ